MSATAARTYRFQVGTRYWVEMTVPVHAAPGVPLTLATEWDPDVPNELTAQEQADYERHRDRFVADLAAAMYCDSEGGET